MTLGGGEQGSPYFLVGKFLGCYFSWSKGGSGFLLFLSLHLLCFYFFIFSFIPFFFSLILHFSVDYFYFLKVEDILVFPRFSSLSPPFFFLLVPSPLNFFYILKFYLHVLMENNGENMAICPSTVAMKRCISFETFWCNLFYVLQRS